MIPGSFAYHRPQSLGEATALLASLGDGARVVAGGHSLIPMMKLRLAMVDHLIDLQAIDTLRGVTETPDGIRIGALTTQADLIANPLLARVLPIIRETALLIADPQIRAWGTLGGNVANGDPGNDMPALMQCLDAHYVLQSGTSERLVKAREFYHAAYVTALEAGEILTAVLIPTPPAGHGWAYEKQKRKVGDYATAAAAVMLSLQDGIVRHAAIALTNVGDTPLFAGAAGAILTGQALDAARIAEAVAAAEAITSPASDGRGPAEYRTRIAGVMVRRAIERAATRAAATRS